MWCAALLASRSDWRCELEGFLGGGLGVVKRVMRWWFRGTLVWRHARFHGRVSVGWYVEESVINP